jgi:hypothetical protein
MFQVNIRFNLAIRLPLQWPSPDLLRCSTS